MQYIVQYIVQHSGVFDAVDGPLLSESDVDISFWIRLSDENHEGEFLTDDKFKLPPNWVLWAENQMDNAWDREHHVISLIRRFGHWINENYWDVHESANSISGHKLAVCERNVPGDFITHETIMSGKQCAGKCSDKVAGQCENFCGKGGTCRQYGRNGAIKIWDNSVLPDVTDDQLNSIEMLELLESLDTYQCRKGSYITRHGMTSTW